MPAPRTYQPKGDIWVVNARLPARNPPKNLVHWVGNTKIQPARRFFQMRSASIFEIHSLVLQITEILIYICTFNLI